jgi:hypothetical protein
VARERNLDSRILRRRKLSLDAVFPSWQHAGTMSVREHEFSGSRTALVKAAPCKGAIPQQLFGKPQYRNAVSNKKRRRQ